MDTPGTPISAILEVKGSLVHYIKPESSVLEAVHLMNEKRIGALLVINKDQPVGIFTERDVLTRVVGVRRDPADTIVSAVMSSNLITIKASITVEEAMRIVTEKRRRHLPVIEDNQLLGLISIGDLTRWMVREKESYVDNLLDYIQGSYPG